MSDITDEDIAKAVTILKSDAQAAHNKEMISRLDRLDKRIPAPPPEPAPAPEPASPPAPVNDPGPPPPPPRKDPEPPPKQKSRWWGEIE